MGTGTSTRPPGRPRTTDDRAIAAAVLDSLVERGFDAMTVDDVAARAGVGRATIYRRWPTKAAMVGEALGSGRFPVLEDPDTGDVRADLVAVLTVIHDTMRREGHALLAIQLELARHPELGSLFRREFVPQRQEVVVGILQRGVDAGLVPPDADLELLARVGPALLWQHFGLLGGAPDPDLPERIAGLVLSRPPERSPRTR